MNISQRQATIFVLGFQLSALLLLWLNQLLATEASDPLVLGAGLAAIVYGAMLFAYLRGWEYARHLSVVFITLIVATFLPEPFITTYAPFLILLGPVLALVLLNPRWVVGSAVATVAILLVRAGGVGVYANLATLVNYAMLIAGLVVSRMISDSTRLRAEQAEEKQRYQASLIENVSDAIISTDAAFNIRSWNHAAEVLYGWGTEEVIGRPLNVVIQNEFVDTTREQSIAEVFEKDIWKGEVIQRSRNGNPINILSSVSVLRDRDKQNTGLVAINRDVTERKQVEQQLARSENEFRALAENSLIGIFRTSTSGQMMYANEALAQMLEFDSVQDLMQQSVIIRYANPEDRAALFGILNEQGKVKNHEVRALTKYDRTCSLLLSGILEGQIFSGTVIDITERKRAEEQLGYQAHLLENVNDAILAADANYILKAWNPAAEKLYGWTAEEVIGQNGVNIVQTQFSHVDADEMRRQIAEAGHYLGEATQLRKDGSRIPVEIVSKVLRDDAGNITDYVSVIRDISARKLAEENIERQNRRLSVLREIDMAILSADSVENIIRAALDHVRELINCRRAAVALFAWGTNEALMFDVRTIGESSIPKGMRVPLAPFQDLIQTLSKNQPILLNDLTVLPNPPPQFQAQIKDGLRSLSFLPLFSQGALIGSFSLASEVPGFFDEEKMALAREVANQLAIAITQQNLLEGLRDQQARVEGIINSAMDAIISIDSEQRIILFNPAAEAMFQCEQAEVLGLPVEHFLPERFRLSHAQHIENFAQTGVTSRAMGALGTIYGLRRNGEEFPIEASISQTQVAGKKIFTVILRDVTERKLAEDELKRSNTELEQFAYVASHDLQEPLRAVAGMVQLLGQRYKGKLDERADEYIGHAVEASGRMQNLINDLLDYSRVDRLGKPFALTDLEKTLDIALANLQVAIQESSTEITRDPLPTLMADTTQLTQVLQNLIGNAIKFRAGRSPKIHVGAEKFEKGWRLSVRDNGIGIEPQYFDRIFLVFQRLHTRREYTGTGIGLSLCKKIVERHGGEIWVESQPERGSTFYFTIPER